MNTQARSTQMAGIMGSHMINMVNMQFWYNVEGLNVKCIWGIYVNGNGPQIRLEELGFIGYVTN